MKKIISALGIFLAMIGSVLAQDFQCSGMYGMMSGAYGFGGMWLFGWLFGILVLVVLVLLIIWLFKQIQKKR